MRATSIVKSTALAVALSAFACAPGAFDPGTTGGAPDSGGGPGAPDAGPPPVGSITGTLSTSQSLSGNVVIGGDVTIAAGVTITIEAGAHVAVANAATISVKGTLLVNGADAQLVTFEPDVASGSTGWMGVVVSSGGTATIKYAKITKSSVGLTCSNGAAACGLDHTNLFDNNLQMAIDGPAVVTRSVLEKSTGEAITLSASGSLTITDTKVLTTGGDLIVVGGGALTMDYSEVGAAAYEHCGFHINSASSLSITHSKLDQDVYAMMIGGTTNGKVNANDFTGNQVNLDDLGGNVNLDLTGNYFDKSPETVAGATLGTPMGAPLVAGVRP